MIGLSRLDMWPPEEWPEEKEEEYYEPTDFE